MPSAARLIFADAVNPTLRGGKIVSAVASLDIVSNLSAAKRQFLASAQGSRAVHGMVSDRDTPVQIFVYW